MITDAHVDMTRGGGGGIIFILGPYLNLGGGGVIIKNGKIVNKKIFLGMLSPIQKGVT